MRETLKSLNVFPSFMNRHVLLSVGLAVLLLLAGCTGSVSEFSASPAAVDDTAVEKAGYQHGETSDLTVEETVGVGGVTRDVKVTNWVSTYAGENGSAFVALSTPDVEVGGVGVNPLTSMSNREVIGFILERVAAAGGASETDVPELKQTGASQISLLGESTEVVHYRTTVEADGQDVPMRIHVATTRHDGDVLVLIGLHPDAIDEQDTILSLMESVEHPTE